VEFEWSCCCNIEVAGGPDRGLWKDFALGFLVGCAVGHAAGEFGDFDEEGVVLRCSSG